MGEVEEVEWAGESEREQGEVKSSGRVGEEKTYLFGPLHRRNTLRVDPLLTTFDLRQMSLDPIQLSLLEHIPLNLKRVALLDLATKVGCLSGHIQERLSVRIERADRKAGTTISAEIDGVSEKGERQETDFVCGSLLFDRIGS